MLVTVCGLAGGAAAVALGYGLGNDLVARAGAAGAMAGAVAAGVVAIDASHARGRWTTDLDWHRLTIWHLSAATGWLVAGMAIGSGAVLVRGADPEGWSVDRLIGPLVLGCFVQVLIGSWSHLAPAVGPGDPARHARQRQILGRWPVARLAALNVGALLVTAGSLTGNAASVVLGAALGTAAAVAALALVVVMVVRR
jgi:hypothetical protein